MIIRSKIVVNFVQFLIYSACCQDNEQSISWHRNSQKWMAQLPQIFHEAILATWNLNRFPGRHDGSYIAELHRNMTDLSLSFFESFDFPVYVMNLEKRKDKRRQVFIVQPRPFSSRLDYRNRHVLIHIK